MAEFYEVTPTLDNYWRSIVLFGRNVASYKFALAKSLLEFRDRGNDLIRLDELAQPFSRNVCEHLAHSQKQATSSSSKFLDSCREFNSGELDQNDLESVTVKLGFNNVIDAFHVVNHGAIPELFFIDERKENKGIRLTENLFKLLEGKQANSLAPEVEARWRLVETAWDLNISRNLIEISYDPDRHLLTTIKGSRRVDVTSCRDALNGYQKGLCFYCFRTISIAIGDANLADVDHFFPHVLKDSGIANPVDGVWNLVLACSDCNRGEDGKFARLPSLNLLARLKRRNDYLISSHHPLRETLTSQTGSSVEDRRSFLQKSYADAKRTLIHTWEPEPENDPTF
jgi:5-methylcytosine-specific restriction endonuclease McrA